MVRVPAAAMFIEPNVLRERAAAELHARVSAASARVVFAPELSSSSTSSSSSLLADDQQQQQRGLKLAFDRLYLEAKARKEVQDAIAQKVPSPFPPSFYAHGKLIFECEMYAVKPIKQTTSTQLNKINKQQLKAEEKRAKRAARAAAKPRLEASSKRILYKLGVIYSFIPCFFLICFFFVCRCIYVFSLMCRCVLGRGKITVFHSTHLSIDLHIATYSCFCLSLFSTHK